MAKCSYVLFLLLVPSALFGQANRYVVFFKDKLNTPYSVTQPSQFLTVKSLDRRAKQGIDVTADDLPVNPSYVAQVKGTGARTYFTSRWLNCLLVEIGADSLNRIQVLPCVSGVELVAPGKKLIGGRSRNQKRLTTTGIATATTAQLEQLGIDEMHASGFLGESITIAVLDGGFPGVNSVEAFVHLFQNGQVKGTFDFVRNSGNAYQYDEHGTEVLSTIGANLASTFTGGAPGANFYLYVTEDVSSEYRIEEYNWLCAAEKADSVGVDIISSSLGYNEFDDPSMDYSRNDLDGKTSVVTQAAVKALDRGMIVVCSAGNEGNAAWHYVTSPADAEGILSCGAVTSDGILVPFSSVGPTADGRIKPDVVARGYGDAVIQPDGSVGSRSGTSFACPLIASLAAGVWQAYPHLTSRKVYEAIIRSADQAHTPDNLKGYGLPNFRAVRNYLEAAAIDDAVVLYPNPVNSALLNVRLKDATDESVTITIYDVLGRALSESTIQASWLNNPIQINVGGMTSGLYLLKVKSATAIRTYRWVKG